MNGKRWAIRTVRNGRVKIGGRYYRPQERYFAYDGRCEGHRFLFGRYPAPWLPGGYEPHVCLWGTEEACRSGGDEGHANAPHVVDGSLPWAFWDEVQS